MTFSTSGLLDIPQVVFVSTHNTVYAAESSGPIYAWQENEVASWRHFNFPSGSVSSVFATSHGELFAATLHPSNVSSIRRWTGKAINGTIVAFTSKPCYGLFVDDVHRLYCSLGEANSVMMLVLNDSLGTNKTIAGGEASGSSSTQLSNPKGIFVSTNYSLYVADFGNGRVQLFLSGHTNAITVAGTGAPGTIDLINPSAVVLDADGYLFIVDKNNSRVVGSGPDGFRCILACSGSSGSEPNQLRMPSSLSFDSHGNIFVTDRGNKRIQKFLLI